MHELMKLYTIEELETSINVISDLEYITGEIHKETLSTLETLLEHKINMVEEDISEIQSDMCKHASENIRKKAPWILS